MDLNSHTNGWGRYPWTVKVDKTEVTEEGLRVEGHKEYDVKSILKLLEECIDGSCEDGCSYFCHMPCVGSLLDDAKGCIEQLMEKIEEDEHEIDHLSYAVNVLTSQTELNEKISKLEDDNSYLSYEVNALTSQNQALRNENEKIKEEIARLKLDFVNEKRLKQSFNDKLCDANREIAELKNKNYVLSSSNDHLNSIADEALRENQTLRKKLEAFEKEKEELKKKLVLSNDTSEARRKSFQYYLDKSIVLEHEVESLKRQNQALSEKLGNANLKTEELDARLNEKTKAVEIAEKMLAYAPARNCINCDHYAVCATVVERKVRKANDYRSCSLWKKADEK